MLFSLGILTGPIFVGELPLPAPYRAQAALGIGNSVSLSTCYSGLIENEPLLTSWIWKGSSFESLLGWSFGQKALSGFKIEAGARVETGTAGYKAKAYYNGPIITQTALTGLVGVGYGYLSNPTGDFGYIFNINGGKILGEALDVDSKFYGKVTFGIVFNFGQNKLDKPNSDAIQ